MKISVDAIEAALKAEDIEGFLAMGAPENHYANDARDIEEVLARLPEGLDARSVAATDAFVRVAEKLMEPERPKRFLPRPSDLEPER